MNQFYLTLPSNTVDVKNRHRPLVPTSQPGGVSQEDSENTQSEFRIRLPQRIVLDGDWEVALSEIIYPHSWFNIDQTDGKGRYIIFNDVNARKTVVCEVEPGSYETPKDLVTSVNNSIVKAAGVHQAAANVKLRWDPITKRAVLKNQQLTMGGIAGSQPFQMFMGEKLRYMLGFELNDFSQLTSGGSLIKAKYPVDLRAGLDALYIYCDLVTNQVVGHVLAPLLRVVAVEGHHDDIISKTYTTPHYLPVVKREFDTVEINIKDDRNAPVRFLYGKTIVKLHFRKKKFVLL
jgi:hypothetical protein